MKRIIKVILEEGEEVGEIKRKGLACPLSDNTEENLYLVTKMFRGAVEELFGPNYRLDIRPRPVEEAPNFGSLIP